MVMGEDSCSISCEVESQHRILDGFFTLICCKNNIVSLKRRNINEKDARRSIFKKDKAII